MKTWIEFIKDKMTAQKPPEIWAPIDVKCPKCVPGVIEENTAISILPSKRAYRCNSCTFKETI